MNPRFLLGPCLAFACLSFACDEAGTSGDTDTLAPDTTMQDADTTEEVAQGPRCVGTAKTCASLTDNRNLCVLTTGCSYEDAECSGVPTGCSLRSSATCEDGFGCYWSSLDRRCDGVASDCSFSKNEPIECQSIGCRHEVAACTGTATPCSAPSMQLQFMCQSQSGCRWEN